MVTLIMTKQNSKEKHFLFFTVPGRRNIKLHCVYVFYFRKSKNSIYDLYMSTPVEKDFAASLNYKILSKS